VTPSSPSAKDMGPIERELTVSYAVVKDGYDVWVHVSWPAFRHLQEAARRLGLNADRYYPMSDYWRDIASEAIEAASELNL